MAGGSMALVGRRHLDAGRCTVGRARVQRGRPAVVQHVDIRLAIDETVILLHPPLPLVGAPTWMERGCQQNDCLVRGCIRPDIEQQRHGVDVPLSCGRVVRTNQSEILAIGSNEERNEAGNEGRQRSG